MSENKDIIQLTIESIQQDFRSKGSIDIELIIFDELELWNGTVETLACSYIRSEWNEGIYYDPASDRFFFYGEPRAHSYGGRQWAILIDSKLLPLLPPALVELLKKVAETQTPITIPLDNNRFLEI